MHPTPEPLPHLQAVGGQASLSGGGRCGGPHQLRPPHGQLPRHLPARPPALGTQLQLASHQEDSQIYHACLSQCSGLLLTL